MKEIFQLMAQTHLETSHEKFHSPSIHSSGFYKSLVMQHVTKCLKALDLSDLLKDFHCTHETASCRTFSSNYPANSRLLLNRVLHPHSS